MSEPNVQETASLRDVAVRTPLVTGPAQYEWGTWLRPGRLTLVMSCDRAARTRFALDAVRRLWTAGVWPDGTRDGTPVDALPETPTLWVGQRTQLRDAATLARQFGLPGRAVGFNGTPDELWAQGRSFVSNSYDGPANLPGGDVDDGEHLKALKDRIIATRAKLIVVDNLTLAFHRNVLHHNVWEPVEWLTGLARDLKVPVLATSSSDYAHAPGLLRLQVHADILLDLRPAGVADLWRLTRLDGSNLRNRGFEEGEAIVLPELDSQLFQPAATGNLFLRPQPEGSFGYLPPH